ncbi:CLUMA_CG002549, isoform A [Clunio marinus]|uniref:3-hydroxyisobutyryl-CoA hydrolase, mitochondrial n=1 Tax=Clunio marinus TaxID=568069 RepID=A0A1J1HLL6_9DIPT|nr:CLUMA_CG002549, isoform A [Clunio marinus]
MWSSISKFLKTSSARSPFVKLTEKGNLGIITLDRPKSLNAINGDMYRTLYALLRELEKKKTHIVIRGAGEKAFSAGGDVKEASDNSKEGFPNSVSIFHTMYRGYDLISSYKIPYIAIMDGITMGGVSAFSVPARYRIATERTTYSMPETSIGFINDAGASYFLSRLRFNYGIYMGLTGARISGYDVKKIGIATHFVESKRLDDLSKALKECTNDHEIGKSIAKFTSVPSSSETELDLITPQIDKCFDGDTVDEIYENLNHDGSNWAFDTIRILNKMSPTALKVTHRNMVLGKKSSLRECLEREFRVAINHVIKSDLQEGVRAIRKMKVSKFIRLTEKNSAAIIQINRPNALNAINAEMYNNLYNLIKLLEHSKDVVIFKGSNKLFSAGGDMKSLSTEITRDEFSKSYIDFCLTFELITYYTKPFVVLVDGLALGGAATYAIPGKYRVCTENAIFSMPETAIGYFNDAGSSYFLSRLENSFGVYMGMTGVRVKGFDMKLVGLSTHYVESSKLNQLEESLVNCKNHEDVERVLGTRLLSSSIRKSPHVKLYESGSAGIVQLDRPDALNAINLDMFVNIYQLMKSLEVDKDIVIFKGSGKVFCSGGDVKQVITMSTDMTKLGYTNGLRTFDLLSNYKKPFVPFVDGLAMGGAALYSVTSENAVATERTIFAMPETAIGYFNDAGATYFLSRLKNNFGVYMGMTGARVKGFDVKKVGLAGFFIESHKLNEVEKCLIKCKSHDEVKEVLNKFSSDPHSSLTELDRVLPNIQKCFSGASVEEIYENLNKDGSDWAKATLKTLNKMSPTSLKVVHRSFLLGKNLSLRDCLRMEFRLVLHSHIKSDFKEGVRAMLIDKDNKPKWSRKTIYDVTKDDVDRFFQPSPDGDELTFETISRVFSSGNVCRNIKILTLIEFSGSNVCLGKKMMFKFNARCFCTTSRLITPFIKLLEPGTAGIITLNRPKEVNAINDEMSEAIYHALREFEETKTHVIISGAGGRSFCIGRDMKDILENSTPKTMERFRNEFRSFHLISNYKRPFIALIDGISFGGACCFSMCGKYRVVTERTTIAMPETGVGFFGGSGSSYFLSRLRNNIGIYLAMTGARIKGYDLKKIGLATHFVETKSFKKLEKHLERIDSSDDVGRMIASYSTIPMTFDSPFDDLVPQIERCFEGGTVEEIYENLSKENSRWSKETIQTLNLKSPTSLKVCHRQLYLGKMLTLSECLKMEFRIAVQMLVKSDMREGCRAMLYEKDENPKWNPPTLQEVSMQDIERFFQPVPNNEELEFEAPHNEFSTLVKQQFSSPYIKISETGNAGIITIDRLQAKNAFEHTMPNVIYDANKNLENKKKIVIIKSASADIFSAGGDIKLIAGDIMENVQSGIGAAFRSYCLISKYKIPYITIFSGVTMGGASMFVTSSRYRVATEKTAYAMPEAQVGFVNDSCSSFFLSKLENNVGIYMGMTGVQMKGYDVKKIGIASHYVESKHLADLEQCLTVCENHEDVKNVLDDFSSKPSHVLTPLDEDLIRINKCFAESTVEQILENLHEDGSDWAVKTLKILRRNCPTSVKVNHRLLNRGRSMTIEDCARMEWRLCMRFARRNDLNEGVRAFLVERDMKPKWNPPTIEKVTEDQLSDLFSLLSEDDELTFEIDRTGCYAIYFSAIYEALKDLESKKKVVVVKSASDEVFSAGGDMKDILSGTLEMIKDAIASAYRGFHLTSTYKVPYIAFISGSTIGGGAAFAIGAEYRVATEKTIFTMPEAQVGFVNSSCSNYFLSRLENNVGIYMGMTGVQMKGYDVKKIGLASHFVESKHLTDLEQCLTVCENHEDVKNVLDDFSFTLSDTQTRLDEDLDRINKCFGGLSVEQILQSLHEDGSEWSKETMRVLRNNSPTSVKVNHRNLNLGRYLPVEDCARMEWRLCVHFALRSELRDGVRSLLIDKGVKPKWNPSTIEEVSDGELSVFFSPLPDGDELKFEIKRSTQEQTSKILFVLTMVLQRFNSVLLTCFKHPNWASVMTTRSLCSASSTVIVEEKGNAGVITLNREKALNSINIDMITRLNAALRDFEPRKNLVIIKGAGKKCFCSGNDIRAVVEGSFSHAKELSRRENRTVDLIGGYKKPYIALIDGITMGGGAGLSVLGKYRVATEKTVFAMPATGVGLFPDVGGGYFLPRMSGNIGIYLGLTGFRLRGRDVQMAGVATHFVDSSHIGELENDLYNCKNSNDIDETLYKYSSLSKDNSEFVLKPHLKQIEKYFGKDTVEDIVKALHSDGSEWAISTLKLISKLSPTSLKITLRQLQLGKIMTLRECLRMEYRVNIHCCMGSDFKEGVRALLIDKDQKPNWKPDIIEKVKQHFFFIFFKAFITMVIQRFNSVLLACFKHQRFASVMTTRNLCSANSTVLVEEKGNAGVITLNREKALNSINLDMVSQIYAALRDFEPRKDLVIIKGAGEKSFCAGGDVRAVVEGSIKDGKDFFRHEYRNNELIGSYKKPYIALIDGITMGGGVGLSVLGKYRVATERTLYAMPETAIGLFPDVGGGYFLPRMSGNIGIYLGLTGFRLRGRDVQKAGVATHFVDSSHIGELENDLYNCKNSNDIDETLYKYSSLSKDNSEFVLKPHLKQIEKYFGKDTVEDIVKALHSDGSEWAISTLKLISKMSPTSLKVTLRQLQLGKTMTLRECLQMEYRLAAHCCMSSDFKEGVRALLIDKDQKPNWKPEILEKVKQDYVNRFFAPLPDNDELTFELSKL